MTLPVPGTEAGRAGLAALVREPPRALIALDFDGTLSPIVADPAAARGADGAAGALAGLAGRAGTVAIITGRPAADAVELGGFGGVPGLIVYGRERWQDGTLSRPPASAEVAAARGELAGVLAAAGAPDGTWTEDKGDALAVHTRRTADPAGALDRLRGPLAGLAERAGLIVEPGRLVLELRPVGADKGAALTGLVAERSAGAVLYAGDDLGDIPAFEAVAELRADGVPGLAVCSGSAEATGLAGHADLLVDGPAGILALLGGLTAAFGPGSDTSF